MRLDPRVERQQTLTNRERVVVNKNEEVSAATSMSGGSRETSLVDMAAID